MSPATDAQQLVDALAEELGRPVGLDSPTFRSLAYSSQPAQVDRVRVQSILRREAPPEVSSWLASLGVRRLQGFGRIAANDSLGMVARVCVPVRFDDLLLGYLWLIDEPTRLVGRQLEEAVRYAEEIAVVLYRDRLLDQSGRERERALLARALGEAGTDRETAAGDLLLDGHLATAPAYLLLVVRAVSDAGAPASDSVRVRLADAAERLRRTVAPHHAVALEDGIEVVWVVAAGSEREGRRATETLLAILDEELDGLAGWSARVGLGEPCTKVEGLADACRQARLALSVSVALGRSEALADWAALGAYQLIAPVVFERDLVVDLPRPLRDLLAEEDSLELVETLECYLDCGGEVRAAADLLHLHRSSLYGRLRRIERIAGIDLRSGEDRLALHLGIRMLRLRGELDEGRDNRRVGAPDQRPESRPPGRRRT